MKTALIITTYNRPELLRQCLDSLEDLEGAKYKVIFVDDNSDYETKAQVQFYMLFGGFYFIMKDKRKGIKDSLLQGFDKAFNDLRCDIAINLDGDAIVKPDFISRLADLKQRFPDRIISGFNCNHPQNPVLFDGKDYVERKHCNGINTCIDKQQYETIIKPALLSNGNWDYNSTNDKNFIITKPSVVEHLGANCSTMGHLRGDVSCDFYA